MVKRRRNVAQETGSSGAQVPVCSIAIELPASHAKHRQIVSQVLKDLRKLGEDQGLKIDLTGAGRPKKADLRSALHRAAKKEGLELSTISDQANLYVFRRKSRTGTSQPGA
jgi:hypothetical protein